MKGCSATDSGSSVSLGLLTLFLGALSMRPFSVVCRGPLDARRSSSSTREFSVVPWLRLRLKLCSRVVWGLKRARPLYISCFCMEFTSHSWSHSQCVVNNNHATSIVITRWTKTQNMRVHGEPTRKALATQNTTYHSHTAKDRQHTTYIPLTELV